MEKPVNEVVLTYDQSEFYTIQRRTPGPTAPAGWTCIACKTEWPNEISRQIFIAPQGTVGPICAKCRDIVRLAVTAWLETEPQPLV